MAGQGMPGTATEQVDTHDQMNYHTLDRGKKSLPLNLKTSEGKEIYKRMIMLSDVDCVPLNTTLNEVEDLEPGAFWNFASMSKSQRANTKEIGFYWSSAKPHTFRGNGAGR